MKAEGSDLKQFGIPERWKKAIQMKDSSKVRVNLKPELVPFDRQGVT